MNYCLSMPQPSACKMGVFVTFSCAADINMGKNACGGTGVMEVLWTGKLLGQNLQAAWPWSWWMFQWWGQTLQVKGRMSAAFWPSPEPLPLGWCSPALLCLLDLLLCLGRKGPDVSSSKNLSEMTQMCSWALPTCCSPNVLACLILPCMSAAAGRRRRGPSSPRLFLCRSQAGLDRIAAALTGVKATWKLHILGQAPWMGWTWGYGLTPNPNDLKERGLSPLSQSWSYAP